MSHSAFVVRTTIALLLTTGSLTAQSKARNPRVITPANETVSPNFSKGILVGNALYISGQQGTDHDGHLLQGIGPQTEGALKNLQNILQAAGFSLHDVVSVTVYLADIKDFSAMNKVYVGTLPDPKPTRTTIQAAALVDGGLVEITAVAVKP